METVTSKDGTTIAFDRLGDGPPVVLVCGGSVDRMADAGLAYISVEPFHLFRHLDEQCSGSTGARRTTSSGSGWCLDTSLVGGSPMRG